jgi:hypothetical protein
VIVQLPDDSQLAIPGWMLKPEACTVLKIEARPRISLSSLLDLCRLIEGQPSAAGGNSHPCAESPTGGRDAQQGESGTHGSASSTSKTTSFGRRCPSLCRSAVECSRRNYLRRVVKRDEGRSRRFSSVSPSRYSMTRKSKPPLRPIRGTITPLTATLFSREHQLSVWKHGAGDGIRTRDINLGNIAVDCK